MSKTEVASLEKKESWRSFGGRQEIWRHHSEVLGLPATFGIYLPPGSERGPLPVVYWLSGLTCTERNFIEKGGAQRFAARENVIIVAPDTSPRSTATVEVPDDDAYDLGQGAGFYVNATEEPWAATYRMYDYVVNELPSLIEGAFEVTKGRGIVGHSMGGHGALTIALKNPGRYQSVSAFSPIVAPTQVPWGEKAFRAYLGEDRSKWNEHDTCYLIENVEEKLPILVDQGGADPFLATQLRPELLLKACQKAEYPLTYRQHHGYDHSYYFISSFIEDHIKWHAKALNGD